MTRRLRSQIPAAMCLIAAACRPGSDVLPAFRPAQPPQRIVAAGVLATEVLLEIAPRARLAGVHQLAADARYSLVADAVKGLQLVGAEPEQMLAARPDLVILDAFTRPETMALLQGAGVPLLRTAVPASLDDVAQNIRRIGLSCRLESEAERLVARMQHAAAELRAAGTDLKTWRVCSLDGALHTYGRGSLFDEMIGIAGAQNLAAERGVGPFRKLDIETLLGWNPDALVIAATPGQEGEERKWLEQDPGLALLPCLRKNHILFVPGALLGTTSQHLVETASFVQNALHAWGRP